MKKVLIISYELTNPGRNSEPLIQQIKTLGGWARLSASTYLVLTENTPVQVRDYLGQTMDKSDKLYVGAAPAPSAWKGLPDAVGEWIRNSHKANRRPPA